MNDTLVKQLMEKTHTNKGLRFLIDILGTVYQNGRKVAQDFKNTLGIVFDGLLPKGNCRIAPSGTGIKFSFLRLLITFLVFL